jgi:hypothetical protein
MSKILYPVGTRVVVKSVDSHSPLYVVAYKKGSKYPYRVGTRADDPASEVGIEGKSKFSVKGLKRYTPNEPKKDTVERKTPVEGTAKHSDTVREQKTVCQCDMKDYYTRHEVNMLVEAALDDVYKNLDVNYMELKGDITRLAGAADRNFCKVQKTFKTLNHDDD